ncbi:hypothetical protein [Amycolatopsis sp. NBC_00438]|uniref:hypothetical protein n=1 Tax=Amycolatopsis sp. NBC_00438 TaxID=2903558 RepID=UPI002E24906E
MDETKPSPVLTDLTELEQQVIDAARHGKVAIPATTTMTVEELAITDDSDVRVRADLLRELLRGLHGDLDPRGIRIVGVRVVGKLDLDHVTAVTGLKLRQCALAEGIFCRAAHLRYLYLNSSLLTYLHADGLSTDGSLGMRDATITGSRELGAIRLLGAHIGGTLELERATVTNTTGSALNANRLRTDGSLFMRDATITSNGELGAIRLLGAHIGGTLELDRANITSTASAALHANRLRTDGSVFMGDATITSNGELGAIRLVGAHIGGTLELDRATVTNTTGSALNADSLRTDGSLFMRDATITSNGELGAIRLLGAHIGGTLELDRAEVTSAASAALHADRLRTGNSLFMRDATITGTGKLGAIRLLGAHIGGQADLTVSGLDNSSGPLLVLHEAQTTGALFPPTLLCPAGREGMSRRGCTDSDRTLTAQGLTYPVLREISWRQWLHLLVHHTDTYWPQPFQQLAATERAAGHDNNAREVLITQQHDLRRRAPQALGSRLARARHALWGWLGRYGYRAHRLVTALTVVLTLAAALSLLAGHVTTHPGHHAAERVPPAAAKLTDPGIPCSPVELIGLGIDRGLPLGTTGVRAHCDLDTTTGAGQTFTAILWALQALLWGLATLAIAAYTGLVRKPT